MKKNKLFFWIVPILIFLASGCTTTKTEKVAEASMNIQYSQEDLDRANKKYTKEVAGYRTSVESDLRNNKLRIAKLQDEKTEVKEEALVVRNEKIAAMRRTNDELELRMRQYRGDNRENWGMFKREFDSDMMLLGKSVREVTKDNAE